MMASACQEGGKRGSFYHHDDHNKSNNSLNSSQDRIYSHNHSLNEQSTTNGSSTTTTTTTTNGSNNDNKMIEMTSSSYGETLKDDNDDDDDDDNDNDDNSDNDNDENDDNKNNKTTVTIDSDYNTNKGYDIDNTNIGELPNYYGLSFAYKLQLILLFIEFIIIVFGLIYGILYLLFNCDTYLLLLVIFLMVHIVVYICLMLIIIKLFKLRFYKQSQSQNTIININITPTPTTTRFDDIYKDTNSYIKRTMIAFIILRLLLFSLLFFLIEYQINGNHTLKLLSFEFYLILLIWFDWDYFYKGIKQKNEKLKLGIYLDLITITKYYTILMCVISFGEAIQNLIVDVIYYKEIDNDDETLWICNVHLSSYCIMSLSSLLLIIWIYAINKEKYLYKSVINNKIRFLFMFFASCWIIAIVMIIVAMINVFKLRFNIFDCLLLPHYLIFIIYLLYYVLF